jgi:ATP-dependent phosphofructokinase / diphosphate-dependent phosphofructokinase
MAEELTGNCLIGQSGGPTAVINASVAGAVTEALNHSCIEEVYGCLNGVLGILNEDFIDLAAESQQTIRGLTHTPGAAGRQRLAGHCGQNLQARATAGLRPPRGRHSEDDR